jgi:hypothetical protein
MVAIEIGELRIAVERLHSGRARLARSVRISASFDGKSVWEVVVHIFELKGHPTASRAYAWSSPIDGSRESQFFPVLNIPPITSPVEAVRATVVRFRGRE